jgi:hypothetical protein
VRAAILKERSQGAGRRGEPTPEKAGRPEQTQAPHLRGEGTRGVPPPLGEPAKPKQEGGEHKKRRYLVWHPKAETLEEYAIRFRQEHARRKIEDTEKKRKYHREYQRDRRKRLKEQRQAASAQQEGEQPTGAIQIFPSPREES